MRLLCITTTCIILKQQLFLIAFGNPLYLNPDEMENIEDSTLEPPPDDGTM